MCKYRLFEVSADQKELFDTGKIIDGYYIVENIMNAYGFKSQYDGCYTLSNGDNGAVHVRYNYVGVGYQNVWTLIKEV